MFSLPSARSLLTGYRSSIFSHPCPSPLSNPLFVQSRFRSQLAPRRVNFIKRHKGAFPVPTGGSIKGTTLAFGDWGIRIIGNGCRLTAKQLTAAEDVLKRKLKSIKGAKNYMRVFPDIPVCIKVRCAPADALPLVRLNIFCREMNHVWVKEKARSNTGLLGTPFNLCI